MTAPRLRLLTRERRRTVPVTRLAQQIVEHYSIPAFDATRGPVIEAGTEIRSDKLDVSVGHVLISKLNPRISRVQIVSPLASDADIAVSSTEFVVLEPHAIHGPYLKWWLGSVPVTAELSAAVKSVTRSQQRVLPDDVLNLRPPMLSIAQQERIAAFLDDEALRIVEAARRLDELTETAWEAYLANARRLIVRPNPPRVLLKLVARPGTGHTPSRSRPDYWVEDECVIPWFGLVDVWQLRDDARDYVESTSERVSELGLRNSAAVKHPAGTVIFSRTASVGFVGCMAVDMAVTQDFMTWTCGPLILPEYLLHALRAARPELMQLVQGSTHKTIYMPDLLNIKVPLPHLDEQRSIVEELQPRLDGHRRLRPTRDALHAALASYRDSLVHEAVTGRLDVAHVSNREMEERVAAAADDCLDEVAV